MISSYNSQDHRVEIFGTSAPIDYKENIEEVASSLNNIAYAIAESAYRSRELRKLELMTPEERKEHRRVQKSNSRYLSML